MVLSDKVASKSHINVIISKYLIICEKVKAQRNNSLNLQQTNRETTSVRYEYRIIQHFSVVFLFIHFKAKCFNYFVHPLYMCVCNVNDQDEFLFFNSYSKK